MTSLTAALRIGDDLQFRGVTYRLAGLDGDVARLTSDSRTSTRFQGLSLAQWWTFPTADAGIGRAITRRIGPMVLPRIPATGAAEVSSFSICTLQRCYLHLDALSGRFARIA